MQRFTHPTAVSFLLDMHLDAIDITTKLHVYVTWEGMTFDPVMTFDKTVSTTRQQFCMPPGEYSLKFVFTVGYSLNPFAAIDNILVEHTELGSASLFARTDFATSLEAHTYLKSFLQCDIGINHQQMRLLGNVIWQNWAKNLTLSLCQNPLSCIDFFCYILLSSLLFVCADAVQLIPNLSQNGGMTEEHTCDFSDTACWDYGRFSESSDFTWKRLPKVFLENATVYTGISYRKGIVLRCFGSYNMCYATRRMTL